MEDDFIKNKKIIEERKAQAAEAKKAASVERLKQIVETSIKTTMIGALDDFEKLFGDLWGHGKPFDTLTEEELESYRDWQNVRQSILDRGNNANRITKREIANFEIVDYNNRRYEYKFVE